MDESNGNPGGDSEVVIGRGVVEFPAGRLDSPMCQATKPAAGITHHRGHKLVCQWRLYRPQPDLVLAVQPQAIQSWEGNIPNYRILGEGPAPTFPWFLQGSSKIGHDQATLQGSFGNMEFVTA